ncbi:phosphoenolpyruvate--protein phosphotransferase [Allohahella marinimesophila]|uniref:phosphoenolpyruvate--protein phosphotransferase n=1 Tax=Allohahella marinimesophila TaxID=1054972 RepID=A0ABP7NSE2_9GAMM
MLKLSAKDISLHATASDKAAVIRQIADAMVASGLVDPAYEQGMLAREQQTSTYLGNGIAIPHGTTETRDLVRQTGIKVFRFPEGIAWGDSGDEPQQIVHTAIGIAAKSDEHLSILRQLTHVIGDEALAQRLHTSEDVEEVRQLLTGELAGERTAGGDFLLTKDQVRLRSDASTFMEAVSIAAALLWTNKSLTQAELAMLPSVNPFHLGGGVWLSTLRTGAANGGAAVVQLKTPLQFSGERLHMLIAIATQSEHHRPLLDRLADLMMSHTLDELTKASRAADVVRLLMATELKGQQVVCRLAMPHGLHARPAAILAKLAKGYESQIWVENLDGSGSEVSAQSVTKLISLGAGLGDRLRLTMDGPEAEAALANICEAIAGGLGDPVIQLPEHDEDLAQTLQPALEPLTAGESLHGLQGAPGVAIGQAHVMTDTVFSFARQQGPAVRELERLQHAIDQVSGALQNKLARTTNTDLAQIIAMHLELVQDPEIRRDAEQHIKTGDSAEWGWQQSFEALAETQEQSTELLLAERAIDIRDVGNQVLGELTGQGTQARVNEEHILICEEITPTEISECDPAKVKAIVSAAGGITSHAAILARSLGIPLLVACGPRVMTVTEGTSLIVNCEARTVIIAPDDETLAHARFVIADEQRLNEQAHAQRLEPAITTDGHRVEVMANLTAAKAVNAAIEIGCEGVGLFRSEFIYMAHAQEPSIEAQQAEYASVMDQLGSERPLIVRTLDIGGDKPLPYMPMDEEENPFLGIRGVRLSLRYPDTLKRQLHALLRAANGRLLRIMFPMVTDLNEWRQIRAIYREVAAGYPEAQIELGIMIEVPSAALMAEAFAPELDFFSVGTNDLTQYTLAIDRGHPVLSRQADAISPAVLKLIDLTVQAADRHGIWVGVCGELASDPLGATILTGLGVRELSMSARAIPRIKARLRTISLPDARSLAARALVAESSEAVRELLAPASQTREHAHV